MNGLVLQWIGVYLLADLLINYVIVLYYFYIDGLRVHMTLSLVYRLFFFGPLQVSTNNFILGPAYTTCCFVDTLIQSFSHKKDKVAQILKLPASNLLFT